MKVVIQNGCEHVLNRRDVEAIIQSTPSKFAGGIKQITLYQSSSDEMYVEYYKKSKDVGLFCPKNTDISKRDAIDELLIALACIADRGEYPKKLSKSRRNYYLNEIRG